MTAAAMSSVARAPLRRKLDQYGFFALAFGSMIGVGWVTALGSWLTQAGPLGAMLAFAAGGLVMLAIGLCYAEVTPMLPVAGGEVAYAYKAFGTSKAFLVGWFLAFGYISVSAFEAISVGRVLSFMVPNIDFGLLYRVGGEPVYVSHLLLAFGFTALITWINYVGVERAAAFQKWLIAGFIAITLIFIGVGITAGSFSNLRPLFGASATVPAVGGMLAVFVTVPFWFVGFDTIPQGAEEANVTVPARRLGLLILGSIVAASLFYVVLVMAVSMTGPWQRIVDADLPTARAFEYAFASPVFVYLVLTAALIGLLTSWNGFFLAGSRVLFSLGRARIIWDRLGHTHSRYGTPHSAVLFVGVVTVAAPALGRDALLAFVDVGSFCIGVAFVGVALTVMQLRRQFPDYPRPYRLPGGRVVPLVAVAGALFILAVMIVPGSPAALSWPREVLILAAVSALGTGFWVVGGSKRQRISETDRAYLLLETHADAAATAAGAFNTTDRSRSVP